MIFCLIVPFTDPGRVIEYSYGMKDACAVFFYAMICIIVHQIIQEYVIDVGVLVFVGLIVHPLPWNAAIWCCIPGFNASIFVYI